jgi:ATP-dependent RNA helicase DeaD
VTIPSFADLALSEPVLRALADVGYESPSPIQAATIPVLLSGRDMLGQAQTGTGKTAAFALPVLTRLDLASRDTQVLVLVPTRELAIQVAEAFQRYAAHLKSFNVLPIYGGQSYGPQLASLRRGAQVVIGTPGRVMDHMKRETLQLGKLTTLVLDEADEMLRMGFIDDVEWILEKTPKERQVALFSATLPTQIRRIAERYMRDAQKVTIASKTSTATNIRQRYWMVSGMHKLDALTRILEVEPFDGMLVFARTKQATVELAEKLEARGFAAAPLNGDIPQALRERTVQRLKSGDLDIVVATDVAARGLDVERIGHVVNYDVPTDTESYVHRIGRTGRAGRSGEAILFIAPRERGLLGAIERATRQKIEPMELPSVQSVNAQRVGKFKQQVLDALAKGDATPYREIIESIEREQGVSATDIAAALASLLRGETPLLLAASDPARPPRDREFRERDNGPRREFERGGGDDRPRDAGPGGHGDFPAPAHFDRPGPRRARGDEPEMETFRVEVGHDHGVKPGNIVGALANEAGLDGRDIGRIDVRSDHSLVDLPGGMPKEIFKQLQSVRVVGQELRISRLAPRPFQKKPHHRGQKPGTSRKPRD